MDVQGVEVEEFTRHKWVKGNQCEVESRRWNEQDTNALGPSSHMKSMEAILG